jgi:glucose/arabinose dehydrogenase
MRPWPAIAALGLLHAAAQAQTLPTGFTPTNLITSGLSSPTCFCVAPDGRIFIGQQGGAIRVWKSGGGLLTAPFHQFTVISSVERGLIGLALDPNFAANGYVYAHITRTSPTQGGAIVRVTASAANPDVAAPGSQVELFFVGDSTSDAHVGGALRFGPDGKLYFGVGDNTNSSNAQLITNRFGKVLRINADGSIPADNPTSFSGVSGSPTGQNRAIWALGLRNPFTLAFHPETGRLFINDVGNMSYEEINEGAAGANYGWPTTEGDFQQGSFPTLTRPRHAYAHSVGIAIVGGTFYAPLESPYPPSYYGQYFFGDYGAAWISYLDPASGSVSPFGSNVGNPVDLRVADDGRLLCLSRGTGRLWRLDYSPPLAPTVIRSPSPQSVADGATARFDVVVSGSPVLAYQWRHDGGPLNDGGGISGAHTRSLVLDNVQDSSAGSYDCLVTNSNGSDTSAAATLSVTPPAGRGDTDCDGVVNYFDIDPFLLALVDPGAYILAHPNCPLSHADVDQNGSVDFFDIDPFLACLFSGCP